MKALAALALAGCAGSGGTVQVSLVTAPDAHVLDAVQKLRVTLTQPRQVVEATRSGSGFDLALEMMPTLFCPFGSWFGMKKHTDWT